MEPGDLTWPLRELSPALGKAVAAVSPLPAAGLPALASRPWPQRHSLPGGPWPLYPWVQAGPGCGRSTGDWLLSRACPPPRFVILSVVLFGLVYNPHEACSLNLVDHGRGYLGILLSCMIAEMAIIWLSMRGGILYTEPRESMQYVLYVRLGKGRPPRGSAQATPTPPSPGRPSLLPPTFGGRAQRARPRASTAVQRRTSRLTGLLSRPAAGRLRPGGAKSSLMPIFVNKI